MAQLKINVTLGSLCFSSVSVPVEDQGDVGKFVFFLDYSQLKMNVTLESLGFSWVSVPVVNQCDFVKICAFHWLVFQLRINVT